MNGAYCDCDEDYCKLKECLAKPSEKENKSIIW